MSDKPFLQRLVAGLIILAALGGAMNFLIHDYDPTRVLYKRLKADGPYVYDEINPKFLTTDPRSLISLATPADVTAMRAKLIRMIWGDEGFPSGTRPASVETGIDDPVLSGLPNLASVDRITVAMDNNVQSTLYLLKPAARANGKLVLYHHGFAGEIRDVPDVLGGLLARGYGVLAINMLAYGGNTIGVTAADGSLLNLQFDIDQIERPLRYHFEPIVVGINYALESGGYRNVDMIGFSAGAYFATVAAAIDPRIARSYPVAGVYPLYLREGPEIQTHLPSYYPPLLNIASYPDLFVLGAVGEGRRQLQVFNRYDRCCYNNTKGKLYEAAVAETVARIGAGGFGVFIDETHADHRLSKTALDIIMNDMEAP